MSTPPSAAVEEHTADGGSRRASLPARVVTAFRRDPIFSTVALALAALVALFILWPILAVLGASLRVDGVFGLDNYATFVGSEYYRASLRNSLIIGVGSTTFSVLASLPLALYVTRHRGPLASAMRGISLLPLVAPPFLFGLALLMLGGRRGLLSEVINLLPGVEQFSIYGLHGVVVAQALGFLPVAYMLIENSLRSIDPALEQASRDLGASQLRSLVTIVLPLARTGIVRAVLVVFVLVLADFSNPMLVGGGAPTLAVDALLLITGQQDLEMAAVVGVVLVVPSIIVFAIQRRLLANSDDGALGNAAGTAAPPLLPAIKAVVLGCALVVSSVIVTLFGFVVLGAFVRSLGVNHEFTLEHFQFGRGWGYIQLSLVVSLLAALIAGLLGVLQGYVLARKPVPAKGFQEFASLFGLAVPGTVMGIGYVLTFHDGPVQLTGTVAILVINMAFRNVGVAMSASLSRLAQMDVSLEEASADSGAGPGRTFGRVVAPLLSPSFMAGFVYTFMTTMVTISSVIFLVAPGTNLAAVYILSLADTAAYGRASALAFMLIVIVAVSLTFLRWLERKAQLAS